MRIIETKVYTFEELSDKAKEKAIEAIREGYELAWCDESLESIEAFCKYFGVDLINYQIGPYVRYEYKLSELKNSNFREKKLKDFNSEYMPTGFYLDCSLWGEFYKEFKASGDAKYAFEQAIEQGFIDWQKDMESQLEDEYLTDFIVSNEYEFTEDGKLI